MNVQEQINNAPFLILDGAMGTRLMAMGLEQGAPPEEWNVLYPERLEQVHGEYIAAGSQIILTNSFGGTRFRLKLHNLQDRVYALNKAAAANARHAVDSAARSVLVAGSMGPTGELLEPMGTMTLTAAKEAFAEQARGLSEGGADLLWIETMSDLEEVRAAIEGARSASDLPVAATLSFDTNGRTMMGITASQAMEALQEYDLVAIGANCGHNLPDTMAAVRDMHQVNPDVPLIAKANAGIPRWGDEGELVYDGTPQVMAGYAYHVHKMGAKLIGGCCGSTPAHISAMCAALHGEIPPEELVLPQAETAVAAVAPKPTRARRRMRRR